MRLLIVGTVAFDSVETPFGKVERVLGGSGAYAGCAAGFFSPPQLVGVIGEDFPDEYIRILNGHGIDTEGVIKEQGKTFHWAGRYEKDVNVRTTLVTDLNVLERFDPVLPKRYREARYLFLANTDPAIQLKVMDQCRNLKFTVLDTMNYWIENTRSVLDKAIDRVDCLLLNDEEARLLCGTTVLRNAAKAILAGHPSVVIIKKGEHGVMMFTKDAFFALPGFPLEIVKDPTGAGDSFAGGFIGWLSSRESIDEATLRQAVAAGSATASFCCEDFSIERFKQLKREELAERASAFSGSTSFEPLNL